MTTITQSIPSLGTPPLTTDPSNFDSRADTLYGTSLPAVITAVNTWAGQANTVAGEVNQNRLDAEAAETAAAASAVAGAASASSAIAAPGTQATSTSSNTIGTGSKTFTIQTGKAFSVGQSVVVADTSAPSTNWLFGQITAHNSGTGSITINVTRAEGSGTLTDWTLSISANPQTTQPPTEIIRVARTSNTAIAAANKGNLIDITSGTFTQTFDAAATLGDGFFCYIRNAGTGDITLDPDSSETIDGLTTYIMYPGEVRLVQCNGTELRTIVLNSFYRVFDASATITIPPGYTAFQGLLWGGGGSGHARGINTDAGGGGGGGACVPFFVTAAQASTSQVLNIGAGGAAATAISGNETPGNAGGNSTLGALVTAYGGAGGSELTGGGGGGALSAGSGGLGGSPYKASSLGTGKVNEGYGGAGGGSNSGNNQAGNSYFGGAGGAIPSLTAAIRVAGNSVFGGGGGGAHDRVSTPTAGGTSVYGGAGGAGAVGTTPAAGGTAPGGGGGGVAMDSSACTSGAGARGELRIWGVI
jgi:hypothetical protein